MSEVVNFVVAVNHDDRLEVLVALHNGSSSRGFWRGRQSASGDWTGEGISLSPSLGFPIAMARNATGRLEAFAGDGDDRKKLWWSMQIQPGGDWGKWELFETPNAQLRIDNLALAPDKEGRLELFATTKNAGTTTNGVELWHIRQPPGPGVVSWWLWESLGSPPGAHAFRNLLVGQNKDGRLEVFGSDGDALWHIWQRPQVGGWSDWSSLGRVDPLVWLDVRANAAGRLVVVATAYPYVDTEHWEQEATLWHREQVVPNGGWSPWVSLGRPVPRLFWRPRLVAKADGQLDLLLHTKQELLHFHEAKWSAPRSVTI